MQDGRSPRLCIVSHERALRWTELIVALRQALSPQDELKIIMDRRKSRPSTEAPSELGERPAVDRRRHPHVDVALNVDGFAIVPTSAGAHALTAPSPVETAAGVDVEVEHTERRKDDADSPRRTETPARAASPHGPRPANPDGSAEALVRGKTLDEADVDHAEPRAHQAELPGRSDRTPRTPNRNRLLQRLYPEEPRDASRDDADLEDSDDGADDAESLSRLRNRSPQFPHLRAPSRRIPRTRIPQSWHRDEPFDDDDDDEPRHGSRLLWVAAGLVAAIGILALLIMGQGIEAFKVGIDLPRPSFASWPWADPPSADQTRQPVAASPDPAPRTEERLTPPSHLVSDPQTEKPPSLIPSSTADLAGKTEPEPAEGNRVPAPPLELPPRQRPQPRRETGSPANTRSSTMVRGQDAASRASPGLPRVELVRSLTPRSPGSGRTYVVRISDARGRVLLAAEASLVAQMSDGHGFSIPLEPGPERGEYRATVPHDRALRDLRVRITTGETSVVVPVER